LDADCRLGENTLRHLSDGAMASGRPVQSLYLMLAPDHAPPGKGVNLFAWRVPTSEDARRCIATIGNSGADLCFVALGAPKQELFADHGKHFLPNISFVCIGAGLDFIAGVQVRAPHWMQRWSLEWLWRAASDPRRLLYRYLLCMAALPGILARAALVPRRR